MKNKVTIALLVTLTLWIGVSVILVSAMRSAPVIHHSLPPSHSRALASLIPTVLVKYPVYPHSIVPGGIHDAADLEVAYRGGFLPADFDMKAARFTRISKALCTYVTFRDKDGEVVWSKHELCLREGELAITDGKYTILARCGNRIAATVPPNAPVRTIPIDLDVPVPAVLTDFGVVSSLYPASDTSAPDTWAADTWVAPLGPVPTGTGGVLQLPPVPLGFLCCAASVAPPLQVPDGSRWAVTVLAGLVVAGAIFAKTRG
jgi:hypothetical protein